ncbi:hypothetical protein [Brevibacterium yomogidense]|uniref:hypothetical protein n=1 Tax=Brevibacterium yomogidense TaxID=946573 RepID=UPI0018E02A5E|nr:hypothetical protein [Brevibacterium yomogidense]
MSAEQGASGFAERGSTKRRDVLAGVAWALPVAAVTSTAPALAASQQEPPPVEVVRAARP